MMVRQFEAAFGVCLSLTATILFGCGSDPGPPAPATPAPPGPPGRTTTTTTTTTTFACQIDFANTQCEAVSGDDVITQTKIGQAISHVCGNEDMNCTACTIDNLTRKGTYIYNMWFQAHITDGIDACQFDGTGKLNWPSGSICRPRTGGLKDNVWCLPKAGTPNDDLQKDISQICGEGKVDCSHINGGDCVFYPQTQFMDKAEFAYNAYFQKEKQCDFGGKGRLMYPDCELYPQKGQLTLCEADPKAEQPAKESALAYVCGEGAVPCHRCVNEANKLSWALNEFFQVNKELQPTEPREACNFNGVGKLKWPKDSLCIPKAQDGELCRIKDGTIEGKMIEHLMFICGKEPDICTPINAGGGCVFPADTDVQMKTNYALNAYYQKWKAAMKQGACDFNGDGEVVKGKQTKSSVVVAGSYV